MPVPSKTMRPLSQSDHAIGEPAGQLDLMEADDCCNAIFPANAMKICKHFLARCRIEAGDRFVGENDLRLLRHGPGNTDALLLAAGELIRAIKGAIEQADPFERLQSEQPIGPRQRKYRSQGAVGADAAKHERFVAPTDGQSDGVAGRSCPFACDVRAACGYP